MYRSRWKDYNIIMDCKSSIMSALSDSLESNDRFSIPTVDQVFVWGAFYNSGGAEDSGAFTAGISNAVVDNAVGLLVAEWCGKRTAVDVVVRVVEFREAGADIVECGEYFDLQGDHFKVGGRFVGRLEKADTVEDSFLNSGLVFMAGIEYAVSTVGESASCAGDMGERSHDITRSSTGNAVFGRNKGYFTDLIAYAVVG